MNRFSGIRQGTDVYGANGDKIGDVQNVGSNYLHVSTGLFGLGRDLYVPFDAVSRVETDRVDLNVTNDQISSKNWSQKPSETAAAPGAYGTMPSAAAPAGNVAPSPMANLPQDLTGYSIYTSDNKEIGKVHRQGANYAEIDTGVFGLGPKIYVPLDCIDNCRSDHKACTLRVSSDQVSTMGWTQPPATGTTVCGPEQPQARTMAAGRPPVEGVGRGEAQSMPFVEDEVQVRRHQEHVGDVDITKRLERTDETIDVPVRHDEVIIEERDVDRPTSQGPSGQGEIRMDLYEEEVQTETKPHVYEEITVRKEPVTEEEHIRQRVTREVPNIEKHGDVEKDVRVEHEHPSSRENEPKQRGGGQ